MKKFVVIIILFTGFLILYVWLHNYSIALTQEVVRLEKELQLRKEEVLRLEIEKNKVFLWANLESHAILLRLTPSQNNQPTMISNPQQTKDITVHKNDQ